MKHCADDAYLDECVSDDLRIVCLKFLRELTDDDANALDDFQQRADWSYGTRIMYTFGEGIFRTIMDGYERRGDLLLAHVLADVDAKYTMHPVDALVCKHNRTREDFATHIRAALKLADDYYGGEYERYFYISADAEASTLIDAVAYWGYSDTLIAVLDEMSVPNSKFNRQNIRDIAEESCYD